MAPSSVTASSNMAPGKFISAVSEVPFEGLRDQQINESLKPPERRRVGNRYQQVGNGANGLQPVA